MSNGALALVLHAHLPYVRSVVPGSLEEDWFFQALMECYLPLLEVLERGWLHWNTALNKRAALKSEAN